MSSDKLTPRQAAFVAEYLIDLNGTQAAIRAGYSPTSAAESACEFLTDSKFIDAIAHGKVQRLARVNMTQDTVLEEMATLAKSSIEHYAIDDRGNVTLAEGAPPNAMGAVQSIKKKIRLTKDGGIEYDVELRLWDKPAPLKLMGRHVGLFPDRMEHSGPNGGPIPIQQVASVVIDPKEVHE